MPLLIAARVALAILIIASLCFVLAYHALRRASSSVVALSIDEEGGCEVRRRSARGAENGQLVDCWVHPLLTLLVLRGEGRRWRVNVVVPADAVGKEAFRRLRVRLLSRSAGA